MEVLVDTSIWIDYFRSGDHSENLNFLLDENLVVTNDIILAELIPYLKIKKQTKVIELLYDVNRVPLDIHWAEIIRFQVKCLRGGANGVGIPDLIIAQNARQKNCRIYSLDNHFRLLQKVLKVQAVRIDALPIPTVPVNPSRIRMMPTQPRSLASMASRVGMESAAP